MKVARQLRTAPASPFSRRYILQAKMRLEFFFWHRYRNVAIDAVDVSKVEVDAKLAGKYTYRLRRLHRRRTRTPTRVPRGKLCLVNPVILLVHVVSVSLVLFGCVSWVFLGDYGS